ncbi:hypothetical protein KGF54_001993 [Candida jiufengensis]|uniref:uncharacterized protein n=1 Tax=Candida jiufengensis TaxID=497108 RepID=UPI002224DA81|nr:uncharacterized protein KGF54_001993 [Candida jiufengensis]KAI5954218.1 hypothetical protein KGF54_001993 [Candida jiufengensis]
MTGLIDLLNADEAINKYNRQQQEAQRQAHFLRNQNYKNHIINNNLQPRSGIHINQLPHNNNIETINNKFNKEFTTNSVIAPIISPSSSLSNSPIDSTSVTLPPIINNNNNYNNNNNNNGTLNNFNHNTLITPATSTTSIPTLKSTTNFIQQQKENNSGNNTSSSTSTNPSTPSSPSDSSTTTTTKKSKQLKDQSLSPTTTTNSNKPLLLLRDHIPKSKINKKILNSKIFVKLAIRRKYSTKRQKTDTKQSKLHIKSLKAGIKIKLTSCSNLFNLYHSLIPFTDDKKLYKLFNDFGSTKQYEDLIEQYNNHKSIINYHGGNHSSISLVSKGLQLIDNNVVDLSEYSNKILKSFTNEIDQQTPTFNSLDTAINTLFQSKNFTLIRITRSTTDDIHGSSILKLETAKPGDFNLIDDEENSDEMLHSLGQNEEIPNNLFFKKIIARPRYKSNMKIYFLPIEIENYSIYTDCRSFERDLYNGIIQLEFENLNPVNEFDRLDNGNGNLSIKRIFGYNRNIYCTFPMDKVLRNYKKSVIESLANDDINEEDEVTKIKEDEPKIKEEAEKESPKNIKKVDETKVAKIEPQVKVEPKPNQTPPTIHQVNPIHQSPPSHQYYHQQPYQQQSPNQIRSQSIDEIRFNTYTKRPSIVPFNSFPQPQPIYHSQQENIVQLPPITSIPATPRINPQHQQQQYNQPPNSYFQKSPYAQFHQQPQFYNHQYQINQVTQVNQLNQVNQSLPPITIPYPVQQQQQQYSVHYQNGGFQHRHSN